MGGGSARTRRGRGLQLQTTGQLPDRVQLFIKDPTAGLVERADACRAVCERHDSDGVRRDSRVVKQIGAVAGDDHLGYWRYRLLERIRNTAVANGCRPSSGSSIATSVGP